MHSILAKKGENCNLWGLKSINTNTNGRPFLVPIQNLLKPYFKTHLDITNHLTIFGLLKNKKKKKLSIYLSKLGLLQPSSSSEVKKLHLLNKLNSVYTTLRLKTSKNHINKKNTYSIGLSLERKHWLYAMTKKQQ